MKKLYWAIIAGLIGVWMISTAGRRPQRTVVVAVPARGGAVDGKTENSDAFMWRLFTQLTAPASKDSAAPVVFETWASDSDTFSTTPHWPKAGEPLDLHPSVLGAMKTLNTAAKKLDIDATLLSLLANPAIGACQPPRGAAVAGFPADGCIVEQVSRNRPQFDYIVSHGLNTQTGLAAAYAKSFDVEMPAESIATKGDWVPVPMLLRWIPQLKDVETVKKLYYTVTAAQVDYALLAMHIISRQNPNWVWGTFEHQMNPGRCDSIGCFDSFGAQIPAVYPNRKTANTQYGSCLKTPQLKKLMADANLSPVWGNYCLKSTEVDFVSADGTPYALGNSVIEGIVGNGAVSSSSCIACHYYASFGPAGQPSIAAIEMLSFNPTGNPIPGVLTGSRQFGFTWGVLLAPK